MNRPPLPNERKVIIREDLLHPHDEEREAPTRVRKHSDEPTVLNFRIPVKPKPQNHGPAIIVSTTVGAIALVTGIILYSATKKNPAENPAETPAETVAAAGTTPAIPTSNPTTTAASSEIPEPAPTAIPEPAATLAINSIPTTSINPSASTKPPAQWPINKSPYPPQSPLPRKSDIIRETPF